MEFEAEVTTFCRIILAHEMRVAHQEPERKMEADLGNVTQLFTTVAIDRYREISPSTACGLSNFVGLLLRRLIMTTVEIYRLQAYICEDQVLRTQLGKSIASLRGELANALDEGGVLH